MTAATKAQEQAHRAQLAKWCVLHKIAPPSGPVVDAFVAEMGTKQYGVEETWDAFGWFSAGFEAPRHTATPIGPLLDDLNRAASAVDFGEEGLRKLCGRAAQEMERLLDAYAAEHGRAAEMAETIRNSHD